MDLRGAKAIPEFVRFALADHEFNQEAVRLPRSLRVARINPGELARTTTFHQRAGTEL
jgi:hypothetical protein